METVLVYMTAPTAEDALAIGRTLVEERLAACANVLDGMRSIYWWEGAVQSETEAVLLAKTVRGKLSALTARVKALHGYQVPCIAAVPIQGGNPDFLEWIRRETADLNGPAE